MATLEPEREEGGDPLNKQAVARIMEAVDTDDRDRLWQEMEPLHAADIADLLEQIGANDRRRLIALYGQEFDGDILSELDESIREEVIGLLTPEVLADAVRELDSDDVVDLVEDLQDRQQETILSALGGRRPACRAAVADLSGILRRSPDAARGGDGPRALDRRATPSISCAGPRTCPSSSITSSLSIRACTRWAT